MTFKVPHPSDTYEAERKHRRKVHRILLRAGGSIRYSNPLVTFV